MLRSIVIIFALLAGACSDGGSDGAADAGDVDSASSSSSTTSTTSTTNPPPPSSTETTSTTSTTTTTTEPPDTEPPGAPTNVSCTPGAGAEELYVEWDAPSEEEEDGAVGFFVYVSPDGNQLARLAHVGVGDAALTADGPRWSTTVGPVPATGALDVAVTSVDEAGNESGWYPINAYYVAGGTSCHSGAPSAPAIVIINRGAGSGEVDVTVTPPAPDVGSYTVAADIDGAGMAPLDIVIVTDSATTPDDVVITAATTDWSLPVVYRVVAIDADGNASPPTDRSCPPIPGPDDSC